MARKIASTKIFDAVTISNGAAATSPAINIEAGEAFSLHLSAISGTVPSVTFTYSIAPSTNGPFTTPVSPSTTFSAQTSPNVLPLVPEAGGGLKITATNSGAGPIVLDVYSVVIESL